MYIVYVCVSVCMCVCVFIGRVHGMCVCICCVCSCVCLCALENPFISMAAPHLISGIELPSVVNSLTIEQYHLVISYVKLHTWRVYVCVKRMWVTVFSFAPQVHYIGLSLKD
jgi:hypothetical protein